MSDKDENTCEQSITSTSSVESEEGEWVELETLNVDATLGVLDQAMSHLDLNRHNQKSRPAA